MDKKAGLYIHIPFCASKCPYCDFYSVKYSEDAARDYTKHLCKAFETYRGAAFDTVYFGGGTPSILDAALISRILEAANRHFVIDKNSEITVECNPSRALADKLKEYKKAGVNRVSIGMQSIVKEERLALGRTAGEKEIADAVDGARAAGIFNISLDMMIGTPRQSRAGLYRTLDFIRRVQVPHISAYILKIEPGTPFYKMRGRLELPDDEETANMYLETVAALERQGLAQYEISNFAAPGFESRHNMKYWELAPYLGIGKAAHSFWNGRRFYYDDDFKLVDDGEGGTREEQIMLGLRLTRGIEKSLIKKDISPYISAGLMLEKDGRAAFTPKGFLVSNTILAELI